MVTSTEQVKPLTATQKLEQCKAAGHDIEWRECWNCGGDVFVDHDCGEDVCCCLYPEDNVTCDICDGEGSWEFCFTCHPEAADDEY